MLNWPVNLYRYFHLWLNNSSKECWRWMRKWQLMSDPVAEGNGPPGIPERMSEIDYFLPWKLKCASNNSKEQTKLADIIEDSTRKKNWNFQAHEPSLSLSQNFLMPESHKKETKKAQLLSCVCTYGNFLLPY